MSKYILAALICLCAISGIAAESWTILVYMAADNGLYYQAEQDLIQMQHALLPPNVKVIVQADFSPLSPLAGARRYRIEHDAGPLVSSPIISELGTIDSGDPHTLNSFLKWGYSKYPSDRKMLVIWSHGDGWYKNDNAKWICPDYSSESLMSLANKDLRTAFSGIPKLDVLLLDACSMQSIEVITELSDSADYIIASVDEVPTSGFPYDDIFSIFDQDIAQIVSQIPSLYTASYAALGSQNPHYQGIPTTCSTIKTSEIRSFNVAFKAFVQNYRDQALDFLKIRNQCYEMNTLYADIDILQFLSLIVQSDLGVGITPDALQLLHLWENCVVSYSALDHFFDIGTAAIWFPVQQINFTFWWEHYLQLDFARTEWLSLLNACYVDNIAPHKPALSNAGIVMNTMRIRVVSGADPDPLVYEIKVKQDNQIETYLAAPVYNSGGFYYSIPVSHSGMVYVRSVDLAGNYSDSDSLSYLMPPVKRRVVIAPNPIVDVSLGLLKYYNEEEASTALISIYDLRGRLIFRKYDENIRSGENTFFLAEELKSIKLASGAYQVRIELGNEVLRGRFLVIK